MTKLKFAGIALAIAAMLCVGAEVQVSQAGAPEAPRITIEKFKEIMGKPGVVVLDVRTQKDWDAGTNKIPGAFKENAKKVSEWMSKYGKDKTIVVYCG